MLFDRTLVTGVQDVQFVAEIEQVRQEGSHLFVMVACDS